MSFLKRFLTLFSAKKCFCCGKNTYFLSFCDECQKKYLVIDFSEKRCKICGKVLISENEICFECRENRVIENLDFVFPIFSYSLYRKRILYDWKINGQRFYVPLFSDIFYSVYLKYFSSIPVVPVPPRPKKIWKNGWDQINDLKHFIKFYYKIEVLDLLKRVEVQQQKKLNREERLLHKGNSYILNKKFLGKKLPKEVVLIDDILTTGVTLETCAEILKKNGVKKVHAITLFIAD